MFWFSLKKFVGSSLRFSALGRAGRTCRRIEGFSWLQGFYLLTGLLVAGISHHLSNREVASLAPTR